MSHNYVHHISIRFASGPFPCRKRKPQKVDGSFSHVYNSPATASLSVLEAFPVLPRYREQRQEGCKKLPILPHKFNTHWWENVRNQSWYFAPAFWQGKCQHLSRL